jgi:hypothetical protein
MSRLICFNSLGAIVLFGTMAFAQEKEIAPPSSFFGTWVINLSASRVDSQLREGAYKCYIERLEDLGGGKVRMREHRIREVGEPISRDVEIAFNRPLKRPDGRTTEFRVTGPRSYQILASGADGVVTPFVVTRTISEDGRTMRHIGEGILNGLKVRNDFTFDRADGVSRSGECSIDPK